MERTLAEFIAYLHTTKNTSNNTEISYQRDLRKLIRYLQEQDICRFCGGDKSGSQGISQ